MTNNGANVNATGSRPLPIPCPLCTDLPSALIRHRQPAPATHRRRCPSSGESYGSKMTALHSTGRLSKATVASFVETLLIQRRGPKRASSPVRRTRPGRSDGAEGARREVRAQACGVAVRARGGRAECILKGGARGNPVQASLGSLLPARTCCVAGPVVRSFSLTAFILTNAISFAQKS